MRLSNYINSLREGRKPSSAYHTPSSASGVIEVQGVEEVEHIFDQLLSNNPTMDRLVKRLIAVAMREARTRVSRDIRSNLTSDPRKAYRAVKHMVYKRIFGGNISILAKRKSGAPSTYEPPRTSRPGQRGGNRIKRVNGRTKTEKYERNRLDKYEGADRGFVLRFISSGTIPRQSRYGNRGSLPGNNMFGHIAPWHMQQAIEEISEAVAEYINQTANG